jgi:hypothetical protein
VCLCVHLETQHNVPLQSTVAVHTYFVMYLILYRENDQISLILTLIYTLSTNMRDLKKTFEGRLQGWQPGTTRWKQNKASVSFLFCCNLLNVTWSILLKPSVYHYRFLVAEAIKTVETGSRWQKEIENLVSRIPSESSWRTKEKIVSFLWKYRTVLNI